MPQPELIGLLHLRACRYEHGLSAGPMMRLEHDGHVLLGGRLWAVDRMGLPGPEIELLVTHRGKDLGRFVLTPTPGYEVCSNHEWSLLPSLIRSVPHFGLSFGAPSPGTWSAAHTTWSDCSRRRKRHHDENDIRRNDRSSRDSPEATAGVGEQEGQCGQRHIPPGNKQP